MDRLARALKARLAQANEGLERFNAASRRWEASMGAALPADLRQERLMDGSVQLLAEETIREMEASVQLMRGGLPHVMPGLAQCLVQLGTVIHDIGSHNRALPVMMEAVGLLKEHRRLSDARWAEVMMIATQCFGMALWDCGRLEEAAASLREAIEMASKAASGSLKAHIFLTAVYMQMGRYQEAIDVGMEATRVLSKPSTARSEEEGERENRRKALFHLILYPTLANAHEGLGNLDVALDYDELAIKIRSEYCLDSTALLYSHNRIARLAMVGGHLEDAERYLNHILSCYLKALNSHGGLASTDALFRDRIIGLDQLVAVKRGLGKEEEARLLELDLEETAAILNSQHTAILQELRAEMAAGSEAAEGNNKKTKPSRKQQKRKAAQRRRAEAQGLMAADEQKGEDGVEGITAAAAQLDIKDEAAAAKPEPDEPEPEPDEPEPEECAICLNDLPPPGQEGGGVLLACSHAFHAGCLARWKDKCLEKGVQYTCAMCRRLVVVATAET